MVYTRSAVQIPQHNLDAEPSDRYALSKSLKHRGEIMIRTIAGVLLSLVAADSVRAQAPRTSAPITNVSYEITADSAAVGRRQLGVSMSFQVSTSAPVILSL